MNSTYRPGTPEYKRLVSAVKARIKRSHDDMQKRYKKMQENEDQFAAYIKTSEMDDLRKKSREQSGKMDFMTVEVPYAYAMLMTAHTYYTSVFMGRTPTLQVQGRHGEGEMQTQAVEAVLDYQLNVGCNLPQLFIWLLDPGKYGFGVLGHYWDQETIRTRRRVEVPETFFGIPIPGKTKTQDVVEDTIGYEGNKFFNVRPQDTFPDTRVPLVDFQKGEFFGRYVEITWGEILAGQKSGKYFNVDVLKKGADRQQNQPDGPAFRDLGSETAITLPNTNNTTTYSGVENVPVGIIKAYELCVKLVPSEWGVGKQSDRTEMWVITVTTGDILIGCQPMGLYHGRFPYDILPNEADGYSIFSMSALERSKPLNDVLSWLLNTHFYNVRASLNNQFIADPMRVVMKDLENPNAGKIIRLKPAAYGQDVRTMLAQLPVADATRTHMQDMQVVEMLLQRASGVNDNVMGMVYQGGRKTATEVRSSTSYSSNRMKTQCEWYSAVGWGPLTQKLIQSTQQNMTIERKLRVAGDTAAFGPQFLDVNPEVIAGFFDFLPVDGTLPVDRFAQVNLWQMLLGQMQKSPQILMQYDMGRIFAWVAQLAGLKNINQFKIQAVAPEALDRNIQAGNVVPMPQRMNMNEPGQIPGMGPTG